ncbi:MAG: hypothetical protein MZW92_44430 [Comamonadaceae bacterium]|nr:hypothetical protein [Comamonadaceae bacterium]
MPAQVEITGMGATDLSIAVQRQAGRTAVGQRDGLCGAGAATGVLGKTSVDGDKVIVATGVLAVPLNGTVLGLPAAGA